ncbi:MAG: alpha-E domain-containing protein [Pseudomonadota bacterium]
MLGKTAGGLYWMFRFLERSENTARLVEAGFRIALTRSQDADREWDSILTTAGALNAYLEQHEMVEAAAAINFLLRSRDNPSSVISVIESARSNARTVRTALTTEVWEAVNESWMTLTDVLQRPVRESDLPRVLGMIRQQSALVRGAMHGTMLRNDGYDFARIGTFLERADNTARILDVKYYTLLPSASFVGSSIDNVQWETILRSVSAHSAFRWLGDHEMTPSAVARFLILDRCLPRSLVFCATKLLDNLEYLADDYGVQHTCHDMARDLKQTLVDHTIESILDQGLHEFIGDFIARNNRLGNQIESDFRFVG